MSNTILLIEDNEDIVVLVRDCISALGFELDHAGDGESGLEKAIANDYLMLVLDINLPKLDGMEVCQRLRAVKTELPILMITANEDELHQILGLEFGADDYMNKPFSVQKFRARVKALLRRVQRGGSGDGAEDEEQSVLQFGPLVIDQRKHVVSLEGKAVALTPREYDLLVYLARSPGTAYSRSQLLQAIWDDFTPAYETNVNTHINRLRSKLEKDPANAKYILTVRGVGYRFATPDEL